MAEQLSLVNRRNILLGLAGGAVAAGGIAVQQTGGAGTFAELLRPAGLGDAACTSPPRTRTIGRSRSARSLPPDGPRAQAGRRAGISASAAGGPPGLRNQAFVARSTSPRAASCPRSQLLTVSHKEGGTFDIFMTGASPARPLRMLAVFN